MKNPIKLLVVEDHPSTRFGMIAMLSAFDDQFAIAGEAANAEEALQKVAAAQPDVVLTDLHFAPHDPTDGIDLIGALRKEHPHVRVVLITAETDDQFMLLAHDAGADAFLWKHAGAGEIAKAIEAVASGFSHFPSRLRQALDKRNSEPRLTERESQLIPYFARGLTSKMVAAEISRKDPEHPINHRTVDINKGNIRRKFGLPPKKSLVPFAVEALAKMRK